ncbi:MAG TPA: helix-turn-helix domain-containing protein [Solirubrobacterales bacterium]|jgi:AcrR family transcriptional regulator
MSTKSDQATKRRRYRKRLRAQQEDETRRRITEATVGLHGTIGPAQTTISAIAERAGVQRATVYRHFPDEESLFAACSAHWIGANPRPDLGEWAAIADPDERLRVGLGELYAWFERGEYMLEKTSRDAAVVPALGKPIAASARWSEAAAETLMEGRPERGSRRRRARAALGHAVTFGTWRSLVRDQGLSRAAAVALMAAMVGGRARSARPHRP